MFDLTGRRALVTGAGQGVGRGIAAALLRAGASVAVNDLDAGRAEHARRELAAIADRVVSAPFDVTDVDAVATGVDRAAEHVGGGFDIVVNNAGVPTSMRLTPFIESTPDSWRPYVELNLYGSLHCVMATLPGMRRAGHGRIVQISSGAGQAGVNMGISLYGASKSAVEGFIRHLSQEVAGDGITANALALGLMDNAVSEAEIGGPDMVGRLARAVPVGRLGTPDDAGAAAVFLSSDEAEWLTGQTIHLDGGQTTT